MQLRSFMFVLLLFGLCQTLARAQPGRDKEELSWDRNIHQLFKRYCYKCHNSDSSKGEVNLSQDEDLKMVLDHRDTWLKVGDQLSFGAMPPENTKQPSEHEAELMSQFVDVMVRKIECGDVIRPGKPVTRRLNRIEFQNSVNALTGWSDAWSERISPDPTAYGFDNIGEVMALTDTQLQQFDDLAVEISNKIFELPRSVKSDSPAGKMLVQAGTEFLTLSETQADEIAAQRFRTFATAAYRRPLTEPQCDALKEVYDNARKLEENPSQALRHVVRAILISPRFLFRIEQAAPNRDDPYLVEKYDLVSRLSFFLWAAPPDEKLLNYAATHDLDTPQSLQDLTKLMRGDDRIRDGLVNRFFMQWLRLSDIDSHTVDLQKFDDFDPALIRDMKSEVSQTVFESLQTASTLAELLSNDSVYVSRELAEFYGLSDQFESARQQSESDSLFLKLSAGDSHRGGLLTTAAVLLATSDPNRTNVPRRGNYVASVFLGDPPPPPPPGVPELDTESGSTVQLTLREKLELHRSKAECANCHAKMDPIGFALENFDAVGRWRELDNGKSIDASGKLVSGEEFDGPIQFKQCVLQKQEKVAKQLIQQMLTYAIGRGPVYTDECVVNATLQAWKDNGGRVDSIVDAIVTSDLFRYRINPEF